MLYFASADTMRKSIGPCSKQQLSAVIIFSVLVVARLYVITHQSLWFDEGYTLAFTLAVPIHQAFQIFVRFTTSERLQPLHYAFMFFWSRFAGSSDLALRLPSALFSIAAGLLVYRLSYRMVGKTQLFTALATLAYLLSSFSICYAQEARPYGLVQFSAFQLVYLWIADSKVDRPKWRLSAGCTLCFLMSPFTALLVVTLCASELLLSPRSVVPTRWPAAIFFSVGIYTSYLGMCRYMLPVFFDADVTALRQPLWMNLCYSVYGICFGSTIALPTQPLREHAKLISVPVHGWSINLPSLMVIVACGMAILVRLRRYPRQDRRAAILALAVTCYAVLFFIGFGAIGRLNILPRHFIALFPAAFSLLVLFFSPISTAARLLVQHHLSIAAIGYFVINVFSILNYYYHHDFQKDDYRGVAQMLRQQPESMPTFMASGRANLFEHYGFKVNPAADVAPKNFSRFVLEHSHAARQVQIVVNEHRSVRWNDELNPTADLSPLYSCEENAHSSYIGVYSCRRLLAISANTSEYLNLGSSKTGLSYAN